MEDQDLHLRMAKPGSSEHHEVVLLHELICAATADYVSNHHDPRFAMRLLMSVLPSYAGSLFATLMFMGEVRSQDTARMVKSVGVNFRSGIKVGLNRAKRVASETGYMGTEQ